MEQTVFGNNGFLKAKPGASLDEASLRYLYCSILAGGL